MTIDKTGALWRGTEASDLDEMFETQGGPPIARVEHSKCEQCGNATFALKLDYDEGAAVRTCTSCQSEKILLDGADYIEDAALEDAACVCEGEVFEIAVGFEVLEDGDIRWVHVAARCVEDGTMGIYVDWKIDYSPTDHLFATV